MEGYVDDRSVDGNNCVATVLGEGPRNNQCFLAAVHFYIRTKIWSRFIFLSSCHCFLISWTYSIHLATKMTEIFRMLVIKLDV